mmetsp:Transcript_118572/g.382811  ORF Transcript_118572/g.382811 Transcript_118572/m.382811 type:complete len:220 (-) Transcript_118572:1027-1686(-)
MQDLDKPVNFHELAEKVRRDLYVCRLLYRLLRAERRGPGLVLHDLQDKSQELLHLAGEEVRVVQAPPPVELVIGPCRHHDILDKNGYDDVEETKRHEDIRHGVHGAVEPAVGLRQVPEDRPPRGLAAVPGDHAAEEREEGHRQAREGLGAVALVCDLSEGLPEEHGDEVEGHADEDDGPAQRAEAPQRAVDHDHEVAKHLQPADPQDARDAEEPAEPEE